MPNAKADAQPRLDDTVVVAFFIEGRPLAVSALVTSEAPLSLFTRDPRVEGVELPRAVVLVWHRGGEVVKGNAEAIEIRPWRTGHLIEIRRTSWADVDRRIYPRFPMQIPVNLRAVHDTRGATVISLYQGLTDDVSIGGAWVTVQPQIAMGSLVECQMDFLGEKVQAFAMVAHESPDRGGIGLEFLDFVADSRERLEKRLPRAA
ncbi:MAG: hypothetical protein C4320_02010 [Armatimonadota bacterium]